MGILLNLIKRVSKIFNKDDIKRAFRVEAAISEAMLTNIRLWTDMYRNAPPWLSNDTRSLNLSASIAGETARLATIEMKSEITGSKRAEYLNEVYSAVIPHLRNCAEYAAAKGGLIFKPYISAGKILVDYVQADSFFPTAFDSSGNITGAVFFDRRHSGVKIYTRLEYHLMQHGSYTIQNAAFVSETETDIGRRLPLSEVEAWRDIQPFVKLNGITSPLFSYFKMPMSNTIDASSPVGVSVYSGAVDLIKQADLQYSRLLWEFESGNRALYVDESAFRRDDNGNVRLPDKRLYRLLNQADGDLFEDWTPTYREKNLLNGLNAIMRRIEFNCGLAYGTLSDVQNTDKTAEEIRASKQRSYAHVCDVQKALKVALTGLAEAMNALCDLYSLAPSGDYEMSFDFDDSIVADRKAEFTEKQTLVSLGVMQKWEFRAWYFGEDEQTAKANTANEFEGVPEL